MPYVARNHTSIDEHLARWARWQRAQGIGPRTIADRAGNIHRFAERLGIDPRHATADDVVTFLDNDSLKPSSRRTYFSTFRVYFAWLVDVGEIERDPMGRMRAPKAPRHRPRPITTEGLHTLLDTRMHQRTRTMILLAAYQGFRVSEVAKVRGEHLSRVTGELEVVGKGGFEAVLPLHPLVAEAAVSMPSSGWWFPQHVQNVRGAVDQPILANSISAIIKQAMVRAGVPGSAHSLRHWYGTNVLKAAGGNLRVAQELLRHENIQNTAIYTAVDDTDRRAAIVGLPTPAAAETPVCA